MVKRIGWIRIHRKILDWQWYHKSEMVHLFLHLVLTANRFDFPYKKITIKRGQLKTCRKYLSDETGISEQIIRTCLERLILSGEITIKSTSKYSVITICNYDKYQPVN